jgi:putative DNA primase/helicase
MSDNSTQTEHSMPTFWSAPEIAKTGYKVFPVKGKAPSVPGGFYAATTDHSQIAAWIEDGHGTHDIAIATGIISDVVVIDADSPEAYAEMEAKYGAPTVKTPRGGHWWFRHPRDGKVVSHEIREHLDRKADGGYVLVPPSRRRTWTSGIPDKNSLPVLPPELRGEEKPSTHGASASSAPDQEIPEGRRNTTLTSLAGYMRRKGMDEQAIFAALKITNEQSCSPPLEVEEVARIAASVSRYEPAGDGATVRFNGKRVTGEGQPSFNLTDLGNAERLVHRHGHDLRYCWTWGKWLVWDGKRWKKDDSGEVFRFAKETVASIYGEAEAAPDQERRKALAGHAMRSEAGARIKEMVDLARSDVPVLPEDLDASPDLLNTLNGTVDLRTGELREHCREDLTTKIAPVEFDPDAEAPTWAAFLERVLPAEELRGFVERAAGYSATGDTSEQCMFINHGTGANGKSTFQEALSAALGDYAMRAPTEMLLARRPGSVPNDVARLKGARFVTAAETEEGRRLAESLVKDLTGQDTITARFMRAEWFDFRPTHKLWLSTNHKPEIRGTDVAIWRRIRLVPWSVVIPPKEQDKKLPEKLRAELPGILAWIVRGCLEWRRDGLRPPDQVRRATVEYRTEMDVLAAFLADCCQQGQGVSAFASDLWNAWRRWCQETGESEGTQKRFGGRLAERGFLNHRDSKTGRKVWSGVGLHADWEERAGVSLNHATLRFAGNSESAEPSEPKNDVTVRKSGPRGEIHKKGSEGSEGSADDYDRMVEETRRRLEEKL